MSLHEDFDDELALEMAEALGEPVVLQWPDWNQDKNAFAIVEEGFVEEGKEYEISKDLITVELPTSWLPECVTTQQLKARFKVVIKDRGNRTAHVWDRRPLGGGGTQLICAWKKR